MKKELVPGFKFPLLKRNLEQTSFEVPLSWKDVSCIPIVYRTLCIMNQELSLKSHDVSYIMAITHWSLNLIYRTFRSLNHVS